MGDTSQCSWVTHYKGVIHFHFPHPPSCSYVYALLLCGDLLISGAGDGSVLVWDVDAKVCLASLKGHTGSVLTLACDATGCTLFSGSRSVVGEGEGLGMRPSD